MNYLRVKGWEKFQHYKDRTPPWIKLHRDLLNDYKFSCLQDASKAHLMLIWLLASQLDNRIPDDADWVSKRIGSADPVDLETLIKSGFLVRDSKPLADCYQDAMPETEGEAEKEDDDSAGEEHELDVPGLTYRQAIDKARQLKPDLREELIRVALIQYHAHPSSKRAHVAYNWTTWCNSRDWSRIAKQSESQTSLKDEMARLAAEAEARYANAS